MENHPHLLLAASTLGDLHVVDVRDGSTVKTFKGNTGAINDIAEVSALQLVVTAGDDRVCRVFDLRGLE